MSFGKERKRYAGKRVVVIGSGHSAMDSILNLVRLKKVEPATEIIWAMRSQPTDKTFGGGAEDQLSNRGALGERAKATIVSGACFGGSTIPRAEFFPHEKFN